MLIPLEKRERRVQLHVTCGLVLTTTLGAAVFTGAFSQSSPINKSAALFSTFIIFAISLVSSCIGYWLRTRRLKSERREITKEGFVEYSNSDFELDSDHKFVNGEKYIYSPNTYQLTYSDREIPTFGRPLCIEAFPDDEALLSLLPQDKLIRMKRIPYFNQLIAFVLPFAMLPTFFLMLKLLSADLDFKMILLAVWTLFLLIAFIRRVRKTGYWLA